MDIVERLKCYLASDSAVAEHGHEARLISKDALETAIAEIERLRAVAGAVSQGESFGDIKEGITDSGYSRHGES